MLNLPPFLRFLCYPGFLTAHEPNQQRKVEIEQKNIKNYLGVTCEYFSSYTKQKILEKIFRYGFYHDIIDTYTKQITVGVE